MIAKLTFLIVMSCSLCCAQTKDDWKKAGLFIASEVLIGKTAESNDGFPETSTQKQFVLSIGRNHENNAQQWASRLKHPKTGISLGITDFGNPQQLGYAISLTPFIEFKAFGSNKISITTSIGASYFNKKYDSLKNFNNNAVTTDLTWAFKFFFYYKIYTCQKVEFKITAGAAHHSNGHIKLMNHGYNSILFGLSAELKNPLNDSEANEINTPEFPKTSHTYYGLRAGYGQNVLALPFNNVKDVYTISSENGKVYNNTFKLAIVINYRFYEHYYNYINDNESLVRNGREFENYRKNPFNNASSLSVGILGEVILNHIGINFETGYNLYKPGYKIEWRLNEGWDNTPRRIPDGWVLGEYNTKYKLKQHLSTRLGLKYYIFKNTEKVKNNFFAGVFLNANLGQADFTEITCGYVHNFNFKN